MPEVQCQLRLRKSNRRALSIIKEAREGVDSVPVLSAICTSSLVDFVPSAVTNVGAASLNGAAFFNALPGFAFPSPGGCLCACSDLVCCRVFAFSAEDLQDSNTGASSA
eukprot:1466363-Rhodomonas_salina.1